MSATKRMSKVPQITLHVAVISNDSNSSQLTAHAIPKWLALGKLELVLVWNLAVGLHEKTTHQDKGDQMTALSRDSSCI